MTSTYKCLGQNSPAATTLTDMYTVPSSTSTTISSLVICNTNASQVNVRVSVAVAGAADTGKQYILYDLPIIANDTFVLTCGFTLAATDVLRVYSTATLTSFSAFGVEIS